jgi:hypothetical protein
VHEAPFESQGKNICRFVAELWSVRIGQIEVTQEVSFGKDFV